MRREIDPEQVRAGMYILGFGGSWFDHPFWRGRFLLKSPGDVERVRSSGVPHVVIDDDKGLGPLPRADSRSACEISPPASTARRVQPPSRDRRWPPPAAEADPSEFERARRAAERREAAALVTRSKKVIRHMFDGARLGRAVELPQVLTVVDEIAASVERFPQTLLDVVRLKTKDEYTYLHSIAVCTLMVNIARQMGKGDAELRDYGLAGLLHDIGKMGIDDAILNKPGRLTDSEFVTMRDHPHHGHKMLSASPEIPEMALDVCLHHHEKTDGTGYPFGLPAETLSLAARVGAICDVYDAVTSESAYKNAWTPIEAVQTMWDWDGHFDRALLFTFCKSIGIFPPGLIVEIGSNRLAVTLEPKRRDTRPRVLAFYATREREFMPLQEIAVAEDRPADAVVALADPAAWDLGDWTQGDREGMADRLRQRAQAKGGLVQASASDELSMTKR